MAESKQPMVKNLSQPSKSSDIVQILLGVNAITPKATANIDPAVVDTTSQLFGEAKDLLKIGEYQAALDKLNTALKLYIFNRPAHYYIKIELIDKYIAGHPERALFFANILSAMAEAYEGLGNRTQQVFSHYNALRCWLAVGQPEYQAIGCYNYATALYASLEVLRVANPYEDIYGDADSYWNRKVAEQSDSILKILAYAEVVPDPEMKFKVFALKVKILGDRSVSSFSEEALKVAGDDMISCYNQLPPASQEKYREVYKSIRDILSPTLSIMPGLSLSMLPTTWWESFVRSKVRPTSFVSAPPVHDDLYDDADEPDQAQVVTRKASQLTAKVDPKKVEQAAAIILDSYKQFTLSGVNLLRSNVDESYQSGDASAPQQANTFKKKKPGQ